MDFERATVKALFYDYPLELAVKMIEAETIPRCKNAFMDELPQLIRWREQAFTTTEAFLMKQESEQEWMCTKGKNVLSQYPFAYRPLILVIHLAKHLLVINSKNKEPIIKFDQQFRWKDITQCLGEDLFSMAFKASWDMDHLLDSKVFLWPDRLHHDNQVVDNILTKGLSDIHAHHNATVDIFALNWISLTNLLQFKSDKGFPLYQDIFLTNPSISQNYSFLNIVVAASYLRIKLFEQFVLGIDVPMSEYKVALNILKNEIVARDQKDKVQINANIYRISALSLPNGRSIDYAIRPSTETILHADNPNLIFQGERNILYQFFCHFLRQDKKAISASPYFYLYLLIKTRIQREIIQINPLKGFENFEKYQNNKGIFISEGYPIANVFNKTVALTTLGPKDHLESRISPSTTNIFNSLYSDYSHSIFSRAKSHINSSEQLTFVVHFIKPNYTEKDPKMCAKNNWENIARYASYRTKCKTQLDKVIQIYNAQKNATEWSDLAKRPHIVGIDAAGSELFCRPEVFAHLFRYARAKGITQQTIHAGEDFFDLLDGLRAINEAIFYLQLDSNSRIGHALAAGIDAKKYYEKRNYRVICPRQYLLDNCVWCLMRSSEANIHISNAFETYLNQLIHRLYLECEYKKPFDLLSYWNSMLLRGNEPIDEGITLDDWHRTANLNHPKVHTARKDDKAKSIYSEYHLSHNVKENGDKIIDEKFPQEISDVVNQLQNWTLQNLSHKGIAIESNPTSNIKIGHINNYCEHPLLTRFAPPSELYNMKYPLTFASVNTDDRGVFSTSLYQEFSLLALALYKSHSDDSTNLSYIANYIEYLRQNGFKQSFKQNN